MTSDHPIAVRVAAKREIAAGVQLFELRAESGGELPSFSAGAHIDIALRDGMMRQYSLLNAPDNRDVYCIAVARDAMSRGGSIYLHDGVDVGDLLRISEPRCHFELVETARHTVLVAGGIGVTPIWCMAQRLEAIGASWEMHYAARTRRHAALLEEIELAAAAGAGAVSTYFNLDGCPLMNLAAIVGDAPPGSHFYCCGPIGLLEAYKEACAELPAERVHFEQFTAAAPAALDGGFTIELARSRKTLVVAAGQSILDVLKTAGLRATFSCREGVCGSCETSVLSGVPDHRDAILTDAERAEGKTMMICCSGSLSERLVLDL